MVTVLAGISLVKFGTLICYHAIKAFGRQGKKQMRKSKMFHNMNIPLHMIDTSLATSSSVYKHLAATPKQSIKQKAAKRNSSEME